MRLRLKNTPNKHKDTPNIDVKARKFTPKPRILAPWGLSVVTSLEKNTQNKHKDTPNVEVKARKFTPKPRILVPWGLSVVTSLGKTHKTSTKTP